MWVILAPTNNYRASSSLCRSRQIMLGLRNLKMVCQMRRSRIHGCARWGKERKKRAYAYDLLGNIGTLIVVLLRQHSYLISGKNVDAPAHTSNTPRQDREMCDHIDEHMFGIGWYFDIHITFTYHWAWTLVSYLTSRPKSIKLKTNKLNGFKIPIYMSNMTRENVS